jgi:O-antigen/teichoic acid export membrane protein
LLVELSKIAQQSVAGGFYLVAGTAVSTIIGSVFVIIIARLLGPGGYGLYTLCWVLPALLASVADLGISSALTRYGASLRWEGKYSKLASMIRSGIIFNFVLGVVATFLVLLFSNQLAKFALNRQSIGSLVALASVTIFLQCLFTLTYNGFVGLDRMERGALMVVLREATKLIVAPVLVIVGFGVAGAIAGQVVGWVFASTLGVAFLFSCRRILKQAPTKIASVEGMRPDLEMMMRYGLPLYAGNLLVVVFTQYQNIVLAFFTSNIEIGNFSAAVNFAALINVVSTPIVTALFPAFSKLDLQTARDDLRKMLELSVKYTSLLILPMTVAISTLSKDLTGAVYGSAYGSASTYLTLYVCLFLLTGIGYQVLANFFNGIGRTNETLKITIVQLLIFLLAAPVMAWRYQVPGLIVAVVCSALVRTVYGLMIAYRKYGMRLDLRGSISVLAAALASALPLLPLVYYSHFSDLVNVLIGAAVYLAMYLTLAPVFKAIKQTDLEILTPMLSGIRILKPVIAAVGAYEGWLLARV